MFELTNKMEANKCFSHYLFHDHETNAVAIADHSITDLNDPSSTEDGLLVWTGEVGTLSSTRHQATILLPFRDVTAPHDTGYVGISILTACRIEQLTGLQVIPLNVEIADYKAVDYAGHQPEYNADNYRGI
jgi:hypothetical protein